MLLLLLLLWTDQINSKISAYFINVSRSTQLQHKEFLAFQDISAIAIAAAAAAAAAALDGQDGSASYQEALFYSVELNLQDVKIQTRGTFRILQKVTYLSL